MVSGARSRTSNPTVGWVHWFNTDRIHSYLDDTSPDQYEAAYAATSTDQPMVGIQ